MFRLLLTGLLFLTTCQGRIIAQPAVAKADHATLIYSFIKYSEWTVFVDQRALIIGVYGDESFYQKMRERYGNRTVNGRQLRVKRISGIDAADCQVLYIKDGNTTASRSLFEYVKHLQVLIVIESGKPGADADIVIWNQTPSEIKYRLNSRNIRSKGIKVSMDIFRFAQEVVMSLPVINGYSTPLDNFAYKKHSANMRV